MHRAAGRMYRIVDGQANPAMSYVVFITDVCYSRVGSGASALDQMLGRTFTFAISRDALCADSLYTPQCYLRFAVDFVLTQF